MNAISSHTPDFGDNIEIVCTRLPDNLRLGFLPRHFGRHFMLVESVIYSHMGNLCAGYSGGYWDFFDLSNGGCYLAPNGSTFALAAPNGFEATVSANVGGLIATLYAFSGLSFELEAVEVLAQRFHQLREFALEHADSAVILAAID